MRNLILGFLLFSSLANGAATNSIPVKPDNSIVSFSASIPNFSPPATPTDMCVITGSATRVIEVTSFEVSSNQGTAGVNQYFFVKRTTANTGGTFINSPAIPHDSGKAASTAAVFRYVTNPSALGTSAGNLWIKRHMSGISTSLIVPYFDLFGPNNTSVVFQPVVLRGVAESLALNFGGSPLPGTMTIGCNFKWLER